MNNKMPAQLEQALILDTIEDELTEINQSIMFLEDIQEKTFNKSKKHFQAKSFLIDGESVSVCEILENIEDDLSIISDQFGCLERIKEDGYVHHLANNNRHKNYKQYFDNIIERYSQFL